MADQIQELIDHFFEPFAKKDKTHSIGGAFGRNMHLKEKLGSLGKKVVDPVLDALSARFSEEQFFDSDVEQNGSSFWHLLETIRPLAEPQHAQRIAQMLLWPQVYIDHDRSTRGEILKILGKIGGKEIIPTLKSFVKKMQEEFYYRELVYAERAITNCKRNR